jgi:hypothetical protein
MSRYELWNLIFMGLIAVVTTIYAIFAVFQWRVLRDQASQMKEAVNIASDTEVRQLRAYVHINAASVTNIASPLPSEIPKNYKPTGAEITNKKAGPFIDIQIINSGQTPAYKLEGWATPIVLEYPLKSVLPGKSAKQIEQFFTIPRDSTVHVNNSIDKPLTDSEIAALRNGSKAIYINGEITYIDIFKKIRHTKFVLAHNSLISGFIGISKTTAVLEEDAD